jgi:alkylation response protein AidB-like acyl-CoA dehydrogenase
MPLLLRAKSVLDVVDAEAAESETSGRLTERSVAALEASGLFGLLVPESLGGLDASAVEAVQVWEMVCEAAGGAGWVLMACCAGSGAVGGLLPEAGVRTIFADHVPIIGGQGAPRGKAVPEGNGYRLSGRWGYGSGTLHAEYILSSAMVAGQGGAPPEMRAFVVPSSQVSFEGNWDVIGLGATGSVDYSISDVFVPSEFTTPLHGVLPHRGRGLFRAGIEGTTPFGHSAFAMGVGRRILKEIAELATSQEGQTSRLADGAGDIFQQDYGTVEAKLRAGKAFVFEMCEEVDATIARGDELSTRQISLIRLALNNVTEAALDVAQFAYRAAGGVSLRDGVLQRNIRDMMAAGQHRIVSSSMLRECSRDLLGLADGKIWSGGRLVDPRPRTLN